MSRAAISGKLKARLKHSEESCGEVGKPLDGGRIGEDAIHKDAHRHCEE